MVVLAVFMAPLLRLTDAKASDSKSGDGDERESKVAEVDVPRPVAWSLEQEDVVDTALRSYTGIAALKALNVALTSPSFCCAFLKDETDSGMATGGVSARQALSAFGLQATKSYGLRDLRAIEDLLGLQVWVVRVRVCCSMRVCACV